LKIALGLDSGLAANMIRTSDVDTQAARPNGEDRPKDDLPLNCHPAALRAWSVSVTP
jgi:hypothetical protein